jgi:hypothetical protein
MLRFQSEFGSSHDWVMGDKFPSFLFRDPAFQDAYMKGLTPENSPVSIPPHTVQGSSTTLHDGSGKRFVATRSL